MKHVFALAENNNILTYKDQMTVYEKNNVMLESAKRQ